MENYKKFMQNHLDLNEEEMIALASHNSVRSYSKGEMIYFAEHTHTTVNFLESGIARGFYVNESGKDTTWYLYFNNDKSHPTNLFVFDYNSFIHQTKSNLAFEATTDCVIYSVEKKLIDYLCFTDRRWLEFARRMSDLAYSLVHQKYFSQLVLSAEEKYAEFLVTTPHLLNIVPQYHIASYLGITPQHLSRLKKN